MITQRYKLIDLITECETKKDVISNFEVRSKTKSLSSIGTILFTTTDHYVVPNLKLLTFDMNVNTKHISEFSYKDDGVQYIKNSVMAGMEPYTDALTDQMIKRARKDGVSVKVIESFEFWTKFIVKQDRDRIDPKYHHYYRTPLHAILSILVQGSSVYEVEHALVHVRKHTPTNQVSSTNVGRPWDNIATEEFFTNQAIRNNSIDRFVEALPNASSMIRMVLYRAALLTEKMNQFLIPKFPASVSASLSPDSKDPVYFYNTCLGDALEHDDWGNSTPVPLYPVPDAATKAIRDELIAEDEKEYDENEDDTEVDIAVELLPVLPSFIINPPVYKPRDQLVLVDANEIEGLRLIDLIEEIPLHMGEPIDRFDCGPQPYINEDDVFDIPVSTDADIVIFQELVREYNLNDILTDELIAAITNRINGDDLSS